jgi:diadenosine tetraphosphate (Ap4A) HIT family hydrolase
VTVENMQAPEQAACLICRKYAGLEDTPPGGYLYSDEHWRVCHTPAQMALPGQMFIESRRHFLDFAQMTAEEAESFGPLLARLYTAGKEVTGAERIYALAMIDGVPHFHFWLVPPRREVTARGLVFLAEDHACSEEEATEVAAALRTRLA